MLCPKCGHQQNNAEVCESCGIYFRKYAQAKARQAAFHRARRETRVDRGHVLLKALAVLAILVPVVYLLWPDRDAAVESSPVLAESPPVEHAKPSRKRVGSGSDVESRLNRGHAPRNDIEAARNATVFIKTPWGTLGSGFIVSRDCHVITNRHVVHFDHEKTLAEARNNPALQQKLMSNFMQGQAKLAEMQRRYMVMSRRGMPESELAKLKASMKRLEEGLGSYQIDVDRALREEVERLRWDGLAEGFEVGLVDGESFNIHEVSFSQNYDLAMFRLPDEGCPFLMVSTDDDLEQGLRLFTIGSPSGLGYTVTSGIFSGYRDIDNKRFLQTDAPINPGNSGGPLITQDGRLVGINTSILRDTEGIGFSIPGGVIEAEFGHIVTYAR